MSNAFVYGKGIERINGVQVKPCSGCKAKKPLDAFTRGNGPGGLHRHCRQCMKVDRERRKRAEEAIAEVTVEALTPAQIAAREAPPAPKKLTLAEEMPAWMIGAPRMTCAELVRRSVEP